MSYKIFIADDEPLIRLDLKEILELNGHEVVGEARDGLSALEVINTCNPDLLILDIKMPNKNGLELAEMMVDKYPIILLTAFSEGELIQKARSVGVMAYLTKPFRESDLFPAIELAVKHYIEKSQLNDQVTALMEKLEIRKVIEKAKGLIMRDKKFSEEEAFKFIQKKSMAKNTPMKKIAEAIILAFED